MKQYAWPRPAALIGFVLARNLEGYLFISVQRYGIEWFSRPGVIALGIIIVVSVILSARYQSKVKAAGRKGGGANAK
jgi:hypothetical protein